MTPDLIELEYGEPDAPPILWPWWLSFCVALALPLIDIGRELVA